MEFLSDRKHNVMKATQTGLMATLKQDEGEKIVCLYVLFSLYSISVRVPKSHRLVRVE